MNVYETKKVSQLLSGNSYPGRGVIMGKSPLGKAVIGYFIMGRSENSRNRIFEEDEKGNVYTKPFDESKVEDPSLIIYRAIAQYEDKIVVTNGDQTDTIVDGLAAGKTAREALFTREFEPDAPNFTPRISGVLTKNGNDFGYEMSILKSADAEGSGCNRFFYDYKAVEGVGHLIHTYEENGSPLPTFQGEPRRIEIPESIDDFFEELWGSLNEDNRISLYVEYFDLENDESESIMINDNETRQFNEGI